MSNIFVLSAPSGVGKTTLMNHVIDSFPSINRVITATSRSPRDGEVDGVDYYFKSRGQLLDMYASGELVEMVDSYGNIYGTPRSSIDPYLNENKNVIIILDVYGKLKFDAIYKTIGIFIKPPTLEILNNRLLERYGDKLDKYLVLENSKRLARAEIEYKDALYRGGYQHYIDGALPLESCKQEIYNTIKLYT